MSLKTFFNKFSIAGSAGDVLDTVIKKIIYVLVFLIPLWFLPITINAVEFNKQVLFVILTVVVMILWLAKALNQGELRWKGGLLSILVGVFVLAYILSTIFSIRPYGSLVGWPDHLSGSLINVLCFAALFFLIINSFRSFKDSFGLLFAFLISAALVSILGLLQMWGGFIFPWDFTKVASFNTVGSLSALGIFAAIILTIVVALLFIIKKRQMKLFLGILGLLNLLVLININFWVTWIVLAVGMAVLTFFALVHMVQLGSSINWIALPILFLAVALIFIFLGSVLPVRSNLPIEVGLSYRGGWSVVSNALKERPILGSGPETFVFEYAKYKPIGINSTAFWNVRFSNASAQILTLASDLGIFGILAFLAMVIMFIIKTVRVLARNKEVDILKKFLGIAIFSGWMALLISWFLYPQNFTLIFLFWLLMGLFLTENNPEKEYEYNFKNSPKALLITSLAFVVVIILVIGLLYVEGIKFIAEISYRRGINLVQTQEGLEKGMNSLVKSTVINPYADNTYQMLSQLFLYKINLDAAKQDLSQQDRANLVQLDASNAINAAVRATQLSPQDAYNWLLRGQIYRQLVAIVGGAGEWAEASYNEAIKLEPSNPFAYLELGRLYTNRADLIVEQARKDNAVRKQWDDFMVNALKNFDKAIELKPNYAPAHFEEAVVFDKQGKLKEAIAKMEINRQLLPNDSGTAFQLGVLYYRAEMYAQAKGEFIRAIVIDDNYSNARYFLGLLYDREGSKEDAIDQFDRILQANPGNEQIEQILANLKAGKPALGSEKLGPPEQPSEIPIEEVPKAQK